MSALQGGLLLRDMEVRGQLQKQIITLRAQLAKLREAIQAWKCPACNGSGIRENSDVEHYEAIACYKCAWKRAALEGE